MNMPAADPHQKNLDSKLGKLYRGRFSETEVKIKTRIWQVLCPHFFQQFVPKGAAVLDMAAGYCDFINHIECGQKFALDLNEDTVAFANPDVQVFHSPSTEISFLGDESVDVVFTSNFLEHLRNKEEVLRTFGEVYRILKPGGRFMILQPNIRYCKFDYWDFFDHHVPLTEKSLIEGLEIKSFRVEKVISRFLPFTTKSKLPKHPFLVRLYLMFPLAWRIMGKQSFLVVQK